MSKRKINLRYLLIFVTGFILYTLLITGLTRIVHSNPDKGKQKLGNTISEVIYETSDVSRKVKSFFKKPKFLIPNDKLSDGFSYYSKNIETYPKLLISYKAAPFDAKIQLLDIQKGTVIKEWNPDSREISKRSYNPENLLIFDQGADINFEHPLLLKDSSVVFSTGYSIVKINARSEIEWLNNSFKAHHSIELNHRGNLYLPGRNFKSDEHAFLPENYDEYSTHLKDDTIVELDIVTGEILSYKSVISILEENGYTSLLHKNGYLINDLIHLNDVQPALEDGDYWKKGDLLISCRNLSIVFIYRPDTNKIIWLKQGPWSAQHDPHFYQKDKIIVFGNDIILDYSREKIMKESFHFIHGNNEIYMYHFSNDSISTPFSELLIKEKIRTPTQGNCTILPNGDIFVEETDYGRIIFGDSITKKIEFARRVDKDHITALNWSRIIN